LHYHIVAAGDSFNDTAMLAEAHAGFLFHSPLHIQQQFPQFPALEEYEDLLAAMKTAMAT
jgi:phosphoserine/homoserine phosphotransferase